MYGHYRVMRLKAGFMERRNIKMWWIIGCLVWIFLMILIVSWVACADSLGGAHEDAEHLRAFVEMQKAENSAWKYDYAETTTSGCPVDKE